MVFIFTDGVVEAEDEGGEEFGEQRLLSCLRGVSSISAADILKRVMTQVSGFVGFTRQHDDITCLVFCVNDSASGTTSHVSPIPS